MHLEIRILLESAMAMKLQLRAAMLVLCMTLAMVSGGARADDVPLITGEHWTKSTEQLKKVYLIGIANVIQVETAYHAASPPSDAQSFVPRFAKGLKGQTLDSVREALDRWYAANPDRLQRPIIETIWFEMVVPGLQKTS
jgi:hypothetical protein